MKYINKNITKLKVNLFGIKLLLSILIPGVVAVAIVYIYIWFFDLRYLFIFTNQIDPNTGMYALNIALVAVGICLLIIVKRIIILTVSLLNYTKMQFSTNEIQNLKKNIISIIPQILIITILAWILSDSLICIMSVILGQDAMLILRIFFISTLLGTSLTIVPGYFLLDTTIKNFIKDFFNEVDLQEYSDIKTISMTAKIFNAFLIGGVIPTFILFLSISDLNFLIEQGRTITGLIIGKYQIAAMAALIMSIIIPLISALYFYFTLAKPIKQLDQTMSDIDGGNLDIKLKADFTDEVGHITQGLKNMIHRVRESVKAHEELALIEKELDIAEKVQCSVLTQPDVYENYEGYTISVLYRPQNGRVGGDYFNIMNLHDNVISVFLADATGHGMQAALTTMQIDMMNRQSLHLNDPGERFHFLNEYYVSELQGNNLFTACCVNLHEDHITYGGAGHPQQYIIRAQGDVVNIDSTGKLIGAFSGFSYGSEKYDMEKDDALILFTDGAFEQFNSTGEMFGEERFLELISDNYKKNEFRNNINSLNKSFLSEIKRFTSTNGLNDDITIIIIKKD